MLEKLVTNMITSYMGKYIENLDRKNVSVSLWNGSVDLRDLKVKQSALRGMNLPISVKEGRVGALKVRIPWTRLQSEPILFSITDLIIILHPKSAALYDAEAEEEEQLAYKREQLEALEHMRSAGVSDNSAGGTSKIVAPENSKSNPSATAAAAANTKNGDETALEKAKDNSFSSRLKASMLANAQLEVKNVIVMYEDMVTDPTLPVHFTIRLDELSVLSCTPEGKPAFSNPADRLLYKLLQCKHFRIDLDIGQRRAARGEGGKSIAEILARIAEEKNKTLSTAAATATGSPANGAVAVDNSSFASTKAVAADDQRCIVRPTDFVLRLQHQPIPYDPHTPKWLGTAKIPSAEVRVDRQQWDCVWRSVKYVERYDDIKAFFRFRPPSDAHWTPFLRWQFAINATLHIVRKRVNRNKIKWTELVNRKRMQNEYVDLFKRSKPEALDWCLPLTEEEKQRMDVIERALPFEMLRIGRKLSYARLDLERAQYEKRVEFHAKQEAKRERRLKRKNPNFSSSGTDNSTGEKVGWLAWMTGSYMKPAKPRRDILDICDEVEEDGSSATGASSKTDLTKKDGGASDSSDDDEDKTKFTEEEAATMYGILDAKKWTSEQRRILADEFGMDWDEGTSDGKGVSADVVAMMAVEKANGGKGGVSDILGSTARRRNHAFKLQRDGIKAGSIEDDEGAPPRTAQKEPYDLSASFEIVRFNIVLMDYRRCPFADFTLEGAVLTYHATKSTFAAHVALRRVHVLDASIPNSRPILSAAVGRAIAPHPSCPRQSMFVLKLIKPDKALDKKEGGEGIDLKVAFSSAPFDVCFMVPWVQQVVSFWGEDEVKAMNKAAEEAAAANEAASKGATADQKKRDTKAKPTPASSPLVQLLIATERQKIKSLTVTLHGMRVLIPEARKSRDQSDSVYVKQEAAIELPLLIMQNDPAFAIERRKVLLRVRARMKATDRPEKITGVLYPEGVEASHYCDNTYIHIKDLRVGTSYLDPTVKPPRKPEVLSHYILTKATLGITMRKLIIKDNFDVPGNTIDISTNNELCVEAPRKMWLVLLNAVTLLLEWNNNKNGKGSKLVEQGKIFRRGESGEPFHARVIGPRQRFIHSDEDVRPLNQQLQTHAPIPDQDRYVVANFGALLMFHAERPSMPFLQLELRQGAFTVVPHTLDPRDLKRNRVHKDYLYYDDEEDENGEAKKGRVFAVTLYVHSGGADHNHRQGLFSARELLAKYNIPLFNALPHQHQAVEFVTSLLASTKKISPAEVSAILDAYAIVQRSFHTNPCDAVTFVFCTEAEQLKFAAEVNKNGSPEGFVAPPPKGLAYRGELAPPLPIQNQRSLNLNISVPSGIRISIVEPPLRMTDGSGAMSAPLVSSLEVREKVNISFFTTMFKRSLTLSADTLTLYAPSAKYFRSFELNPDAPTAKKKKMKKTEDVTNEKDEDIYDEEGIKIEKKKKKTGKEGEDDDESDDDDLLEDEVAQNEAQRRKQLQEDEYGPFRDVNQLVQRLRTQRGSDVYAHASNLVKELMAKFLANDGTAGIDPSSSPTNGQPNGGGEDPTIAGSTSDYNHRRTQTNTNPQLMSGDASFYSVTSNNNGSNNGLAATAGTAATGDAYYQHGRVGSAIERVPEDLGSYGFDAELLKSEGLPAEVLKYAQSAPNAQSSSSSSQHQVNGNDILLSNANTIKFSLVNFFHERGSKRREVGENDREAERTTTFFSPQAAGLVSSRTAGIVEGGGLDGLNDDRGAAGSTFDPFLAPFTGAGVLGIDSASLAGAGVGVGAGYSSVGGQPFSPTHRRGESMSTLQNTWQASAFGRGSVLGGVTGVGAGVAASMAAATMMASAKRSPQPTGDGSSSPSSGLALTPQQIEKMTREYEKLWHGRADASRAVLDEDGVCDLRPVFRIHYPNNNVGFDAGTTLRRTVKLNMLKKESLAEAIAAAERQMNGEQEDTEDEDDFLSSPEDDNEAEAEATCFIHFVGSWLPRTTPILKIESSTDVSLALDEPLLHAIELFFDLMDALTMKTVGMTTLYACPFADDRYLPMRKYQKVRLSSGAAIEDRFLSRDDFLAMNGILSNEDVRRGGVSPKPMIAPYGPEAFVDGICIDLDFRRRFVMETMHDYSLIATRPPQPLPLPPDRKIAAELQLAQERAARGRAPDSANPNLQTSGGGEDAERTAKSKDVANKINHAFLDRLPHGVTSKHHPVVRLIAEKGVMIRWRNCQAMNSTKVVARRPYLLVHKYVGRTQEQLATMKFPSGWQHQDRLLPQAQHGALYEVMLLPKKRAGNVDENLSIGRSDGTAKASSSSPRASGRSSRTRRRSQSSGNGPNGKEEKAEPLSDGSLTFEFQIIYKPTNMAQQDWALLASTSGRQIANPRDVLTSRTALRTLNTSGHMFTHFLTLQCENLAMSYVQTTLWPLLEHFSNGFITRSGFMTQRGQLSLASSLADRQWSWRRVLAQNDKVSAAMEALIARQSFPSNNPNTPKPSPSTGAWHLSRPNPIKNMSFYPRSCAGRSDPSIVPPYQLTMLHQNIELRSVDCVLPFHEDHCANILARADHIGMWSEICEVAPSSSSSDPRNLDFSGLQVPSSTDSQSVFKMTFENMRMWVATEPTLSFMPHQISKQRQQQQAYRERQQQAVRSNIEGGVHAPHPSRHIREATNARTIWELSPDLPQSALPHMRTASTQSFPKVTSQRLLGVGGGSGSTSLNATVSAGVRLAEDGALQHPPSAIGGVVTNAKGLRPDHQADTILHGRTVSAVPFHIRVGSEADKPTTANALANSDSHVANMNDVSNSFANDHQQVHRRGMLTPSTSAADLNESSQGLATRPKSIMVPNESSQTTRPRTKTVIIDDPTSSYRHQPNISTSAYLYGDIHNQVNKNGVSGSISPAANAPLQSVVNNFPSDFSTCLLGLTTVPTTTSTLHSPDGSKRYVCKLSATTLDMTEVVSGLRCEFSIAWELTNPHQRQAEKHMNLQFGDFMFHGSSKQLSAVCDWVCAAFSEPYVPLYPAKYQQPKAFVVWSQWITKHHPEIARAFSAPMGTDGIVSAQRVMSPLSKRTAGEWTIGAQRMCIHLQDPETKIRSAKITDAGGGTSASAATDASAGGRRRASSRAPNKTLTPSNSTSNFTSGTYEPSSAMHIGPTIVRDPINIVIDITRGAYINLKWMRDQSMRSRYAFGAISGWDLTVGALRSSRKGDSKFVDNVREVVTSRRRFLRIEHSAPWKRRLDEEKGVTTLGGDAASSSPREPRGLRHAASTSNMQSPMNNAATDNASFGSSSATVAAAAANSSNSNTNTHVSPSKMNRQYPASQLAARSKASLGPNVGSVGLPPVKPTSAQMIDGLAFDLSTAGLDVIYGYTVGGPDEKVVYCDLTVDSLDLQLIPRFFIDVKDSLLGLTVRNSMAPMFKWQCHAIGDVPPPADPTQQQWRSENTFKVNAIYFVLLEDPRARKPLPLYFITMRAIVFKNSSDACQTNKALKFTVESIASNGLVSDRDTVVPLIAMQSPEPDDPHQQLIEVKKDSNGLRAVIGCLWVLSPLKHKLFQLKAAVLHPSMSELTWLGTYAEERSALLLLGGNGLTTSVGGNNKPPTAVDKSPKTHSTTDPTAAKEAEDEQQHPVQSTTSPPNTHENDIHIRIHNPRLVIAEHSTLELVEKDGITINFGLIAISKTNEVVEVEVPMQKGSRTASASSSRRGRVGAGSRPSFSDVLSSSSVLSSSLPTTGAAAATRKKTEAFTKYSVGFTQINVASLHPDKDGGERFLLYPSDLSGVAEVSADGLSTRAAVDVKNVRVDIEKHDYEWALHSVTRHLVADEDNLISKKEAEAREANAANSAASNKQSHSADSEYSKSPQTAPGISLRTIDHHTGEIRRRIMTLKKRKAVEAGAEHAQSHPQLTYYTTSTSGNPKSAGGTNNSTSKERGVSSGGGGWRLLGLAGITEGAPLVNIPVQRLSASISWQSLHMRVHSDTVAVYVSLSGLSGAFGQSKPRIPQGLPLSATIPVEYTPPQSSSSDNKTGTERRTLLLGSTLGDFDTMNGNAFTAVGSCCTELDPTTHGMILAARTLTSAATEQLRQEERQRRKQLSRDTPTSPSAGSRSSGVKADNINEAPQALKMIASTSSEDYSPAMATFNSKSENNEHEAAKSSSDSEESSDEGENHRDLRSNPTVKYRAIVGSQMLDTAESPLVVVPPTAMNATLSLGKLEIGVEGAAPLLSLSSPNKEVSTFTQSDYLLDLDAAIGELKCTLEHKSVVQAIHFLYEPYRRIVLPRYGLAQILTYTHCYNEIHSRLVLSGRTVARFSSGQFNHITINGNGHEIHFIEAGRPIVLLDPGLTVYFTNAKLHLYGHLLEHFTAAGNGSYVIVDDTCEFVEPNAAEEDDGYYSQASEEELFDADLSDGQGGSSSEEDGRGKDPSDTNTKASAEGSPNSVAAKQYSGLGPAAAAATEGTGTATISLLYPDMQPVDGVLPNTSFGGTGGANAIGAPSVLTKSPSQTNNSNSVTNRAGRRRNTTATRRRAPAIDSPRPVATSDDDEDASGLPGIVQENTDAFFTMDAPRHTDPTRQVSSSSLSRASQEFVYTLPLIIPKKMQPVMRKIHARGSFEIVLPELGGDDGKEATAAANANKSNAQQAAAAKSFAGGSATGRRSGAIRRALSIKMKLFIGHKASTKPTVDMESLINLTHPQSPFSFSPNTVYSSSSGHHKRGGQAPLSSTLSATSRDGGGGTPNSVFIAPKLLGSAARGLVSTVLRGDSGSGSQRAGEWDETSPSSSSNFCPIFFLVSEENGSAHLTELYAACEYFGGPTGLDRVDYTTLITPWEILVAFAGSDQPMPEDRVTTALAMDLAATYGGGGGSASTAMGATLRGSVLNNTYSAFGPSSAGGASLKLNPSTSMMAHHNQSQPPRRQVMRRKVVLDASSRVEFRFRYGDITLVTNALDQLKRASGHIEHEVLNAAPTDQSGFEHLTKITEEEQQKNAAKASVLTVETTVKQLALFIVDDSMFGSHTNVPLLSISISNVSTPVLEFSSYTTKVHVSAELEVKYYNINDGSWASLVEPVPFDFVLRSNKNVTMEDVVLRKGNRKGGLKLSAINIHVTPVLVQVIARILYLKKRIADYTAEGRSTAADAKAAAAADRSRGDNMGPNGLEASLTSASGFGRKSTAADASNKDNNTFFAYTVMQQLGHDIEIEFCSSNGSRRRGMRRQRIPSQGSLSFDYPRDLSAEKANTNSDASMSASVGDSTDYPMLEHCVNVIIKRGDSGISYGQQQQHLNDMSKQQSVTSFSPVNNAESLDDDFSSVATDEKSNPAMVGSVVPYGGIGVDGTSQRPPSGRGHRLLNPAQPKEEASEDGTLQNTRRENEEEVFSFGTATIWLAKVGTTFVNVGLPTKPRYIIVDVAISQGAKRVLLRTNVSFTNKLPFGVSFKQVGCIQPGKTVTVPRETLRKRCTFLPTVPGGAPDEISMGVAYDALHDFYSQSFLCTANIRKPRSNTTVFGLACQSSSFSGASPRTRGATNPNMISRDEELFVADVSVAHAYYMILTFQPLKMIPNSDIIDCHATLEAPFNLVNATGQPIRVTLHYQQTTTKKGFFRSEEFAYPKIDRITIAAEERYPVTQADPFEDLYISLEILQPTGDRLTSHRKNKHCVMVRSIAGAKERATSIKLIDSRGEELELTIEYSGKDIILSCPFWIVNQTQHYLQITTTSLKKRQQCVVAGMSGDGLGPLIDTPFLIHTPKMRKDPLDAHLYVRVGRHTASGDAVMWSPWSDKVFINAIGDLSIITCGSSGKVVTLSYSVALVGGLMKKTRVMKITPRWIVINRLKHPITVSQNTSGRAEYQPPPVSVQQQQRLRRAGNGGADASDDTIASGLLKVLDTCAPMGTANTICIRHGDAATASTFSAPLSIERLGDHAINLLYTVEVAVPDSSPGAIGGGISSSAQQAATAIAGGQASQLPAALQEASSTSYRLANSTANGNVINPNTTAVQLQGPRRVISYERSYVVHVTCYSRASTLFICIDEPEKPPHVIENRTRFQINVRQRDTARTVAVYRFHTLGFVWEDPQAPKVLQMWMSEGTAASRPIAINLDPSMLVKREHQLSQVIRTLGGIDLYVRVRAFGATYAISVTEDMLIDRARALPFQQYRYQLQIDSINLLAADTGRDILFLTIGHKGGGITASVSQHRVRDVDTDEQVIELSLGVIQLSDEQFGAEHRVVFQTLNNRPSTLRICRRLQRMTPMLQITAFEVVQQPVAIHIADSFLHAAMHFGEAVFAALGNSRGGSEGGAKQSVFETTPWYVELSTPVVPQDSIQNRVAFVEKMNISQITVSMSLYRGDGTEDPIGDRLGSFVSMLVRSVNDARFDWRRIEYDNIYDRLWLLGTFLSNYYSAEFRRQLLNVVHVAGLDVMRGFVTDLLEGYFTSNAPVSMATSKASALVPLRNEVRFKHDTNAVQALTGSGIHPAHEAQIRQLRLAARGSALSSLTIGGGGPGAAIYKDIRQGGLLGRVEKVLINTYAERVSFAEFVANVTKTEFRHFGHLALRQYLRSRDFNISPLLMCDRCLDVEILRETHQEENYNSVLPHPSSRHISWAELAHHASWEEISELVSSEELVRHAETIKAGIAGTPQNVVRIDVEMAKNIRQDLEKNNAATTANPASEESKKANPMASRDASSKQSDFAKGSDTNAKTGNNYRASGDATHSSPPSSYDGGVPSPMGSPRTTAANYGTNYK